MSQTNPGRPTRSNLPRFVKQHADLHRVLLDAACTYADEVKNGTFPEPERTF